MRTSFITPTLTGLLVLAAAWGGYLMGQGKAPAVRMLEAKSATSKNAGRVKEPAAAGKRENVEARIRQLREAKLEEGMAIKDQLPAWEYIRTLSLDQVQQALRIIGPDAGPEEQSPILAAMLYSRWAQLDPATAMETLAGPHRKQAWGLGQNALWTWMKSDPGAAYQWYQKNRELAKELGFAKKMAETLEDEPAASAIGKAKLLGEEFLNEVAKGIGSRMADSAESRETFLQLIAELPEGDRAEAIGRMLIEWGKLDSPAAFQALGSIGDAGKRDNTRRYVLSSWLKRDPAGLQEWLHENPQSSSLDERANLWSYWARERPDDASRWLATRGNPPEMAKAIVHRMQSAIEGRPIPLGYSEGANEATAIRANYQTWSTAEPEEAARWLQATDAKTRRAIDESSTSEKR
ncbi:hypothetical protein [Luteolibacter luteus]|uniref:Uncharacterized protein n=1 Tax=Luteolibacter luteus TaxID=2728835 RepID=A0A858RDY9_9BACT|nr:hypothetical protein [Luteolibacter luteus]QJE94393.1 hypothetical protein HHL09_00860 [Luteolibacter luteus]